MTVVIPTFTCGRDAVYGIIGEISPVLIKQSARSPGVIVPLLKRREVPLPLVRLALLVVEVFVPRF